MMNTKFNPTDKIAVDVPLFIRLLEFAREDAKTDMDLHKVTENILAMSEGGKTLTMDDYEGIVKDSDSEDRPSVNDQINNAKLAPAQELMNENKKFITEAKRFQKLAGLLKESETLDKILDKIADFGLDSLYPDEKKYLDKYSKDDINNSIPQRYGDLTPITPSDLTISPFEIDIEEGYIEDEDGNEGVKAYFVQILHANKDGELLDVDNFKKFRYLNNLGAGRWTTNPLRQYNGDNYHSIGGRYNIFEFDTANEVENFMKNDLKDTLHRGF